MSYSSIKFSVILQESINLLRNTPHFTLIAFALLMLPQLIKFSADLGTSGGVGSLDNQVVSANLLQIMLSALLTVLINIVIILVIKSINNGTFKSLSQVASEAFSSLFGVLVLSFLSALPISIAMAGFSFGEVGVLMLPLFVGGLFLFIKLSLANYVYLLDSPRKSVADTLKYTWSLSRGRFLPLLIFVLLAYVLPALLQSILGVILGNSLFSVLILDMLAALIALFVIVFSFRFYQMYRQ